ncbi:hypothetical protein L7F22_028126 [Adiantum nelumboides]|nr:hypothetical protein [Adiantum nelumboides]
MDFSSLCTCLEKLESNSRTTGRRGSSLQLVHRLLEAARSHGDLYAVVRLLIPKRDVERQHYNLKETSLAILLMHALRIGADSKDGMLLSSWRSTSNYAAGDFTGLAMQVVSRRQGFTAATLSVASVNILLDSLAKSNKRNMRVDLMREILRKATVLEFKWFLRIIFKDLKIGLGENTILDVLHEDARAMMATCVDLKRVCSQFHNRDSPPIRKELTLGRVLKCQHSKRVSSVEAAWLAMKQSEVIAECKFDGDRMQIHRDGPKIWFWSRNGKEHPEYTVALQDALYCCLSSERCVLDGELLVWDVEKSGFKARTKVLNHDAARAARKGLNTSHRLLRCTIRFRKKAVISSEGSEWAILPNSLEELKNFFWQMVERGNEGIVIKRLDSQWAPDNRDGRWSKIKPDYVLVGSDLDLLIIGGYYGSGSRGGKIASFLLALVDQCSSSTRFISICRCGQGLSEDEFSLLESKLSPHIILNKKGGQPPPASGYLVANSHYDCPDVWVSRPEMSVVLQISSEKRIYPTQSFKAGWTFRFPRIVKVRYDKCWKEALGVQEFSEIVRAAKNHGNSLLHGCQGYNSLNNPRQFRKCVQAKRHQTVLPHLQNLDVSHIDIVDAFFKDFIFYICSTGNFEEKQALQIQIKRCGGKMVPNFVQCVTHIVAFEAKVYHETLFTSDPLTLDVHDARDEVWSFVRPVYGDLISQPLQEGLQEIFDTGFMPPSMSLGIISLIPKGGDASTLRQWRPFTLMSSVYKILARMITARTIEAIPSGCDTFFSDRLCSGS